MIATDGFVLSSFTVIGAALPTSPAWLVHDPLKTSPVVSVVCERSAVQLTGPLTKSAPEVLTVTSPMNQPFAPCVPLAVSVADGAVLSSLTVIGAALPTSPAWLVHDPLKTSPVVSVVCERSAVQLTGPLTKSAPEVLTVTSPMNQPFAPCVPLAVNVADGSVRSILKTALLIPAFVLPARSEHAPDDTVTPVPSAEPVDTSFGKLPEQAALRPEPPSVAVKRFTIAETYQPLAPAVPLWTPAFWINGAIVSSTIESVAVAETFPCASLYCAQTVWLPSPLVKVWATVWLNDVVEVTACHEADEQSLPFATRKAVTPTASVAARSRSTDVEVVYAALPSIETDPTGAVLSAGAATFAVNVAVL